MLEQLAALGTDMMTTVLDGLDTRTVERMLSDLGLIKDNLRAAIGRSANQSQPQTNVLAS